MLQGWLPGMLQRPSEKKSEVLKIRKCKLGKFCCCTEGKQEQNAKMHSKFL